jgi:biotin operon repressor
VSRGDVLAKALRAIRLLHSARWTMSELGEALGRGRRTAYRILEVLEEQGLHVESQPKGRKVFHLITKEEMERWLRSDPRSPGAPRRGRAGKGRRRQDLRRPGLRANAPPRGAK